MIIFQGKDTGSQIFPVPVISKCKDPGPHWSIQVRDRSLAPIACLQIRRFHRRPSCRMMIMMVVELGGG